MNVEPKPLILDTRPFFARGNTPCKAIEAAAATLIPGQPLTLITPFDPVPLYTKLGNQGFTHQTRQIDSNTWEVDFRK